MNRCVAEGRRAFLERYAGIESGEECLRWRPVISAMVDGEATGQQILELRPHLRNCPGCRATLKALQDSQEPLAALLPVPLMAIDAGSGEHVSNLLMRIYEGLAGGLHERAAHSATKVQMALEAATTGKVAVVAASAAAAAGGGLATVERTVKREPERRAKQAVVQKSSERSSAAPAPTPAPAAAVSPQPDATAPPPASAPAADQQSSHSDGKTTAEPQTNSGEFSLEEQAQSAPPPAADPARVPEQRQPRRAMAAGPAAIRRSEPTKPRDSTTRSSTGTATAADDEFGL